MRSLSPRPGLSRHCDGNGGGRAVFDTGASAEARIAEGFTAFEALLKQA